MGILALLLTGVTVVACYIDWSTSYSHAQEVLEMSLLDAPRNDGDLRIRDGADMGDLPPLDVRGAEDPGDPQGAARGARPYVDTPVASYVERDGELVALPNSAGLLSSAMLAEAQHAVEGLPDGMGSLDDLGLVYLKMTRMGAVYVAFADSSILNGWQSLAITMGLAELAILVLFFIVSIRFSKWALRPVQEAWDKQREFVSNASHELKTPLSIASANTAILLEEPSMPENERAQWLERSAVALDGMRVLINDMLDLASIDEMGKTSSGTPSGSDREHMASKAEDAPSRRADLSRIAQGAALQFESVSFERGFELAEDIEDDVLVAADTEKIKRIVDILLDNACKYVNVGGKVVIAVHGCTAAGDNGPGERRESELSVSNTGSYIPPEKIEAIFDRFYRADEARARGEGYGLGLSIAQGMASEIGASIEVDSTCSDEGASLTTFRIVFS